MAERASWAVQQVGGVGVQTVEDARHSMAALWTPAGAITSRSGMVPTGAAAVPGSVLATTPTANTFVHVQPFRYVRQSSRGGGTYTMILDSIKDIDILNPANGGTAADPSNSRIDLIIAQQSDTYFLDANSNMVVKRVGGTPAGSPVDPTVTGSADYVLLARVTVPPNATTIQTANIANVALPSAVAVGGLLPVANQAERDAIVNPYDGMQVYRRDTDWVETYDTAWRAPMMCRTAALANITNPVTSQMALLTTDNYIYRWTGSAWVAVQATVGVGGEWQANATQGPIAAGAGAVKLTFGGVRIPANGVTLTSSNTVNILTDGRYTCYAAAGTAFAAGNNFGVGIFGTAAPTAGQPWYASPHFASGQTEAACSATRFFAAGTQLCAYLYNNGSAITLNPTTGRVAEFAVWRVS